MRCLLARRAQAVLAALPESGGRLVCPRVGLHRAGPMCPDPGVPLHAPYVKCNREVREQMGSKKIILHFFTDYVQIAAQDFSEEVEFSDVKRLNERLT